jgi:hypothetical protein
MLGGQLEQQQNGGGSPLDGNALSNGLSTLQMPGGGNPTQDLGQLLGGLLQQGMNANLGSGGGNNLGGGLGTPVNAGNSVTQDLGKLLGGLIEKGLEASQGGSGSGGGGVGGTGGQPNQLFAQHDLQNTLAQAATAIVSALVGAGHTAQAA